VVTASWILTGDLMPLTAEDTPVGWAGDAEELARMMEELRGREPVLVAELSRSGAALAVARTVGYRPRLLMSVDIDPQLRAGVFALHPAGAAPR
jgi:hypothetical protein